MPRESQKNSWKPYQPMELTFFLELGWDFQRRFRRVRGLSTLTDKAYTNAIVYECTVSESQWESSAGRPRRKRR